MNLMKSCINITRDGTSAALEEALQGMAMAANSHTSTIHPRKPRKEFPDRVIKSIRVLVVDDHAVVRAGLRALLEAAGDIQVIGEAENGMQAVQETRRLQPDVVLLDLAMPY